MGVSYWFQIIGFIYFCLTDDSTALILGGKRIHQDYRGKGYLARFYEPVETHIINTFPDIKLWKYTAIWNDYEKKNVPSLKDKGALKKFVKRVGP